MIKIGEIIAAVDIGANYLRMSIAEIYSSRRIHIIEDLIKPTNIGKDTFTAGRISIETMHEICNDLKKFSQLIKDYNIRFYKAVSTSGIREAENKQYVLEQIRLRTGLSVKSINSAQQRFFMLKAVNYASKLNLSKGTLIVNVTSGVVEVSVYEEGNLKFTGHAKIGSLRLRETLSDLESKTIDFHEIMEEFIENKIYSIKSSIRDFNIEYLIGIGGELKTIFDIIKRKDNLKYRNFNEEENFIDREEFIKFYNSIKDMTNDQIRFKYGISYKTSELVLPSTLILYCFLKVTKSKFIQIPMVSLREGLLQDLLEELLENNKEKYFLKDIISSTWYIGRRFKIDEKHAAFVEKMALSIFDQTQKIHKLKMRERIYLQVASILHDVGIFIDASNHCIQSYGIIKSQNIIGFSDRDLELTANTARYHSEEIPTEIHENYHVLSDRDKMIVSILCAILKLAEALDTSHMQKISELKLAYSKDLLYFNISSKDNIVLEEWNFINNSNFFEEVLGIKPLI